MKPNESTGGSLQARVPRFWRAFGTALFGFLLAAGFLRAVGHIDVLPHSNVLDYRVIACGERAVLQHADPYRTEPLRSCEHGVAREQNEPAWSVTPFSLPPYSAALFLPLGALDFGTGRTLWFVLIVLATSLTAAAVAEILDVSALGVAFVLTPTVGILNLHYGETVPFALAAVVLAALALERGRPTLAAVAAGVALLEPAIGLPAVLGLILLVPAARRPLIITVGIVGALGFVAFGYARNLEYLRVFLPAHQHAELYARDQFSLTRLAFVLGAPERIASALGSVSYVVALAVGVVTARLAGGRLRMPALFVLLPLALSTLGGPFVHDVEIAVALPAAIVLGRQSWLARVAVVLLAMQWEAALRFDIVYALVAAFGATLLYVPTAALSRRIAYTLAVAAAVVVLRVALPQSPEQSQVASGQTPPGLVATSISSVAWEWRIRQTAAWHAVDAANGIRKIPTWLGLVFLPIAASKVRGRRQRLESEAPTAA